MEQLGSQEVLEVQEIPEAQEVLEPHGSALSVDVTVDRDLICEDNRLQRIAVTRMSGGLNVLFLVSNQEAIGAHT